MDPPVILALVGVVGRVVPHDHPVVLLTGEGFRAPAGGRLLAIVTPSNPIAPWRLPVLSTGFATAPSAIPRATSFASTSGA